MSRILFFLLLLTQTVFAQDYTFLGEFSDHRQTGHQLVVQTDNKPLRLSFYEHGVVEVVVGETLDTALQLQRLRPTQIQVVESPDELVVEHNDGRLVVSKNPVRLRVYRANGSLVTADDASFGHGWSGKEVRVWKELDSSHRFFGLGEKTGDVNRRGRFFTNWNADTPAYRNDSDPLYCGIPFFSGMTEDGDGFGIFFANSFRSTYNLGAGNKRLYSFGANGGSLRYFIFPGPTMKDVVQQYTSLTGRMPMPPKWALGYQQCRWSYFPEYEVRDVAKEFRQRKIPCDVLYFDIHYMDAYKVFTWHPERFPEPQRLLEALKSDGFKAITIIDPGVKVEEGYHVFEEGKRGDFFLKYLDGELFQGQVWPGWCHFPDFRNAAARSWWGAMNSQMRDSGVDGFWNDMNEPALWGKEMPFVVEGIKSLHNVFGLLMARATYEGLVTDNAKLRPFIVTRAGWAGIQKYAAVWTGDNSASYDDLALSIRTNIGLGLSGVPFVGCDVGGFVGTPDPELYARWMQAASLSPFMRSHTVYDTPDQEPWSYGEETERRCREALERRYRLLPYLYAELYASHRTGLPLYRPVWLDFPADDELYKNDYQHQFLIGSHLLAAPVLRKGQRFQKVQLPVGRWFELETGKIHQGGTSVLVGAGLDSLPLFLREGGILPTRGVQQFVDQDPFEVLELTVFGGEAGEQEVVLDDGVTIAAPEILRFSTKNRMLNLSLGEGPRASALGKIKVKVVGANRADFNFRGESVRAIDDWVTLPAASGALNW